MSNMQVLALLDQRLLKDILKHIFLELNSLLFLNFLIFYHLDFIEMLCLILKFHLDFNLPVIINSHLEVKNLKQRFSRLPQLWYLAYNQGSSNIFCKEVFLCLRANNPYHSRQSQTTSVVFSSTKVWLPKSDLFLLLPQMLI